MKECIECRLFRPVDSTGRCEICALHGGGTQASTAPWYGAATPDKPLNAEDYGRSVYEGEFIIGEGCEFHHMTDTWFLNGAKLKFDGIPEKRYRITIQEYKE